MTDQRTLNDQAGTLLSNVLTIVRQASYNISGEQLSVVNAELVNF